MLLIGESLNVISKKIGKAFKERDPKPIQEEALFQKEKKITRPEKAIFSHTNEGSEDTLIFPQNRHRRGGKKK